MMIKSLVSPKMVVDKIENIDLKFLKNSGITTLFLDIDNTLVPYYEDRPNQHCLDVISNFIANGFKIILVSNNNKERVSKFAEALDFDYYYFSLKPLPFTYRKILKKHQLNVWEVAAIGDQILTDIIGANHLNIFTIYVEPIVQKDSLHTAINRRIENIIRKRYKI